MLEIIKPLLQEGRSQWNEQLKMLLYRKNEEIYCNPLLNLYFGSETHPKKLKNILFSHWNGEKELYFDINEDLLYIPNLGWSYKVKDGEFPKANQEFKKPKFLIKECKIELLQNRFQLIEDCFGDYEYEIEEISNKNISYVTKAYESIKSNLPEYFKLIERYCPRCVIFNTLPSNTNSFAYKRALGISFYNAYQDNYDEVFFIDDIAHQTGHVLMYTMLFDKDVFFTIDDENTSIQSIATPKNVESNRSVEIWFHALYTYYASFICLNAFLEKSDFTKIQRIEALGRILLYLHRCYYDLRLFYTPIDSSKIFTKIPADYQFVEDVSKKIFTDIGKKIFIEIRNKWIEIYNKYYALIDDYTLDGQGYNFDLKIFLKNNPSCLK